MMRCSPRLWCLVSLPVVFALAGTEVGRAQSVALDRPGHTESELGMARRHHLHHHHIPVVAAPAAPSGTPPGAAAAAVPGQHGAHGGSHPPAVATKGAAVATKPVAATPPPAPPPETPAPPAEAAKGSVTGLPLPRWAALRTDDVNMRSGPGTRYPIEWVYKRRDLPVIIDREFEVWRLVHDVEGVKGWVHQATLVGHRSLVITGGEATLRRKPDDAGEPVARLKPGVIGRLRACEAAAVWCEVQVGDYRGFLKRDGFWGTNPNEAVGG